MSLFKLVHFIVMVFGDFFLFVFETLLSFRYLWRRRGLFLRQCEFIGVDSIGIIVASGAFLGAVLGYQLYSSLHLFNAEALLGGTVGVALLRELAPMMTGIMVAGRAGASMAAQISSMRVSEQLDALEVMAVNPIEYLALPRVIAGFLMVPVLSIIFTIVGSLAAYWVACHLMGLQGAIYWHHYLKIVGLVDMLHCLVKSAVFGTLITWMGCFCGFRAYGGARAVGNATRNTVVASCLMILSSDYLMTSFLPLGIKKLLVK